MTKKSGFLDRWLGGALIGEQLAGVSRLVVGTFALLGAVLVLVVIVTVAANRQSAALASFQLDLRTFDATLLQLRRNEKDFDARKSAAELEKHAANAKIARELLVRLRGAASLQAADAAALGEVQSSLDAYLAGFKKAAEAQIRLGLTENEGLQGALRKAVHEAEQDIAQAGLIELQASMLQMRRHEKDFILREREEYVKAHAAEVHHFQGLLAAAKVGATTRADLQRLIESYEKSFAEFVAGTLVVNKELAIARNQAHEAEAPLPKLLEETGKRNDELTTQIAVVNGLLVLLLLVAGVAAGVVIRRSLRTTSDSITTSVASLQDTVNRVRAGEELTESDGVKTKDELGEVWRTVHGLLTERRDAQLKAEAENERLNNSVIAILQAVDQLSRRDLTVKAPVTQDIIGTVSDSINALTEETSRVLLGVSEIAGEVEKGSNNVRRQARMVTQTAEEERQSVGQMIERLADTTQTMNQVVALTEQSGRAAEQATAVTHSALETVNSTVHGMESIRETIAETEKRIKRLGERSQEISGIVNLINTISERTHVLALNAAMQAAVAGEAGRGFAVVAEEVQRLAESSRNATQQIAALVNNIQIETNETINTVNRTIAQVVNGSELAQKSGEQMRRTQEITGELVQAVRRIANASEQQKLMSAELLMAVQEINKSTEHTSQQIETQNLETESLLGLAQRLVESVSVFKLPKMA